MGELETFLAMWERDSANSVKLLKAVARIRRLAPADLVRTVTFFTGPMTIREILWDAIVGHGIHHRGQLSLMCRLAGGQAPGLYGPNREEMAAMRVSAAAS